MDDDLHGLFGHDPSRRASDDEAAARVAVERALSALGDPAARIRVLRWAIERFGADAASTAPDHSPSQSDTPGRTKPQDPAVSVDDLADLFDSPHAREESRTKHR
jgi:hypothetical protein